MQKHRKIFYFPGMISLLIFPLICMCYFYKNQAFTDYRCIDLHYGESFNYNGKDTILTPFRNHEIIYLTDNQTINDIKINAFRVKTEKLYKNNDSINAVKINFEKANYQNFISVLDNLAIDNIPYYIVVGNEIKVICEPPKKSKKYSKPPRIMNCNYYEANNEYYEKLERNRIFENNIKLFKQNWIIFLAYLGIILLNIIALMKWRKIRLIP